MENLDISSSITSEKTTKAFGRRKDKTPPKVNSDILEYDLKSKKGIAIIFSHIQFKSSFITQHRVGAHHDVGRLESCFKKLYFDVKLYTDLEFDDIQHVMNVVSSFDSTVLSCLAIIVLTHGTQGYLMAYDKPYDISYLWKSLVGKLNGIPKLFIIEASKASLGDMGMNVSHSNINNDIDYFYNTPTIEDFLKLYSSFEGSKSWRENNGSWFIQTLCEELTSKASEYDLLQILTIVRRKVAANYEKVTSDFRVNKVKSTSQIESTLTKFLKFNVNVAK